MPAAAFTEKTTANEVAEVFAEQIKGKTVLVTGTSVTGLGFTTARAFAKDAGLVIITGRSLTKLKETEDALKKEYPQANIRPLVLDLASRESVRKAAAEVNAYPEPLHILIHNAAAVIESVRKAAAEVNAYPEPLHILIHNAAAVIGSFRLNLDNLESQFSSDHVSPFLLTKLLAPKLLASASTGFAPRVVVVSSGAHTYGVIDWDTLAKPDESKYTAIGGYAAAKIANVLFAKELTRRSGGKIQAFSLHPGAIATGEAPETVQTMQSLGIYTADGKPNTEKFQWKTREQGSATTVAASVDPSLEGKGGAYLVDSVIADGQVSAFAADDGHAKKLWELTEELLGEKFTFN
uniref:Short-chain dehydrogenase/reductase family protein n=1 Tax=Mycena chlorophos TaxID=658473 RepID=A0ABQ0MDD1_MYCCL|nr:short-chain dehydrogenase/reductase family protein [Mycena chlorophos]